MKQAAGYAGFFRAEIVNKPGRNLATIFCFAFIAANIFTVQFLISGAAGGLERGVSRMGADHIVVPTQYTVFLRGSGPNNTMAIVLAEPSEYRIRGTITEDLARVPGVYTVSPQLYIGTANLPAISDRPVNVYGIEPVTDFTIQPWLERPLDHPLQAGEVIVGQDIARSRGETILLQGRTFTVAGKCDPTKSALDQTIIMNLGDAYELASKSRSLQSVPAIRPGDVNAILIRDEPGTNPDVIGTQIRRTIARIPDLTYATVINRHFSLNPVRKDVQATPRVLSLISVFVVVAALPLIALIAAMVAHERQQEIGLLKAMGAKRRTVFLLVMAESLALSAAGGFAGVIIALGVLLVMNSSGFLDSALQVSFRMPSALSTGEMAGVALLVVVVIGCISALWPAYRSSTMNPYEAIRGGGVGS